MTQATTSGKSVAGVPSQLFGYEVVEYLGEGAASHIYAVSDPATRQVYALKHVVCKTAKDQRFAEQLLNEYEVGRQINNPLIRRVLDAKVNRNLLRKIIDAALVMELVDGTPLDQRPNSPLPEILSIFSQVAKALAAMHSAGFIHCDLKPNNILVCSDGSIKLIDLGQACPALTIKERIQGTPDYIAPEQVKREPVTVRTDVFNFGATLYWALCGKAMPTLFTLKRGDNSFLLDQAIPTPRDVNPQVPEALSNLVMDCTRTNPTKRPGSMDDISRRLELIGLGLTRAQNNGGHQAAAG
ncbi:MAG TPA: serine/threonine-protein kinase [Tepidisphaeraceae bacterium]|nr:serine/threonine-protein kinase [Tepidisphaeraceae bacterium]